MGSTGIKEYTIKINGITQSVKETTTLEAAVKALDSAVEIVNTNNATSAAASKIKASALSDEEKAAKKLADTQKRIQEAGSEVNKEQIRATRELREKTRETQRQIAVEKLAEDSAVAMGIRLTDLRIEYLELSAAQRADKEVGGELLTQIQELDAEYKAIKESTGDFRDSVGNYEKALSGLNEVKDRFELAARGSAEMASNVTGSNEALDAFGATSEVVASSTESLAGVVAVATTAQEFYNAVIKENVIQEKAAAVMDGIRAIQLKAKTAAEALATKGTVAATIAQGVLNVVAAANPYVLLALALITVVGALAYFATQTNDAAESQQKLNEEQAVFLDLLDKQSVKMREAGDDRVKALEQELRLVEASTDNIKDIRKAEDALAFERSANNARQRGFYAEEIDNLEKNKAKLEEFIKVLQTLKEAQAKGDEKIKLDIDLDGKIEKVKVEDAINSVQSAVDNLGRTVKIAVDLQSEESDIKNEIAVQRAARIKADKELAKERKEIETDATRAAEDARLRLIQNSYEQSRRTILSAYRRQVEDLRNQLATEKNLSDKARTAINDSILSAAKQRDLDLKNLNKERVDKELTDLRTLEDARLNLEKGATDRQTAEINIRYDRQIEDLKKRLAEEKDLTLAQKTALSGQIYAAQELRGNELTALTVQQAQTRADAELTTLEAALQKARNKVGEITKRDKTGLKLIDVDATKKNLADTNQALSAYVISLHNYDRDLEEAHKQSLATLKKGTPEYVAELEKYAAAHEDVKERVKKALKEQDDNTKESGKAQMQYYQELFGKIAEYAQMGADLIGNVTSVISQGIQVQIDDMQEQLDIINEKYEKAQEQREKAAENVEAIEERIQTATGGTADALKSQLADAMAARNEAARNEQQLQKEKEKREAEIAKKEKQMKKAELISNIGMSIANTAQAVTKGLSLGFPLGIIAAVLLGALGAIQVGIMTKQLSKLADGGPIVGPSHAGGGVPIGLGYEAEGGEYVINKRSYAANPNLVEFINASNGSVTASDLSGLVPGDTATPIIITDTGRAGEDRIVEAIEGIDIRPVVSVTDINDVQDQVTTVQDLAGF